MKFFYNLTPSYTDENYMFSVVGSRSDFCCTNPIESAVQSISNYSKEIEERTNRAWDMFKDLFFDALESLEQNDIKERNKLPDILVSGNFPPSNVYINRKKGVLGIDVALAGYSVDDINVQFQDDYFELELIPVTSKSDEQNKEKVYLQRGIKIKNSKLKIFVPFSKFDIQKSTALYKDGMLFVEIPFKEEAKPIKLEIKK